MGEGAGELQVLRGADGEPVGLIALAPEGVVVVRDEDGAVVGYLVLDDRRDD